LEPFKGSFDALSDDMDNENDIESERKQQQSKAFHFQYFQLVTIDFPNETVVLPKWAQNGIMKSW
jgi:hypothetical protein